MNGLSSTYIRLVLSFLKLSLKIENCYGHHQRGVF